MHSRDELLAFAIAHEVRNLLTPARGYAQLGNTEAAVRAMDQAIEFAEQVLAGEGQCDVSTVVEGCGGVSRGTGVHVGIAATVLERIIENLKLNAREAGSEPSVQCAPTPGGCRIEVRDDGPGMQRLVQHRKGRGKGLIVCKFLVEQAGGTLMIQSPQSGGTLAVIELPAVRQRKAA